MQTEDLSFVGDTEPCFILTMILKPLNFKFHFSHFHTRNMELEMYPQDNTFELKLNSDIFKSSIFKINR